MLSLFQVKGNDQVDETLLIENPGLWEALELPPINYANDNLPGSPADDATAINHTLGLDNWLMMTNPQVRTQGWETAGNPPSWHQKNPHINSLLVNSTDTFA